MDAYLKAMVNFKMKMVPNKLLEQLWRVIHWIKQELIDIQPEKKQIAACITQGKSKELVIIGAHN